MKPIARDRKLWAVKMTNQFDQVLFPLYCSWHSAELNTPRYDGEPTRPLLFTTRKQCSAWCKAQSAHFKSQRWKFSSVRVTETIST